MAEPRHVVAKSIPKAQPKEQTNRRLWARVAFYYPQYTLKEASKLSLRDIKLLLKVADIERATEWHELTQISAAPHTEKGKGVKDLLNHYQEIMTK